MYLYYFRCLYTCEGVQPAEAVEGWCIPKGVVRPVRPHSGVTAGLVCFLIPTK